MRFNDKTVASIVRADRIVNDGRRTQFSVVCCIKGVVLQSNMQQMWSGWTGSHSWHSVQFRADSCELDVDEMQHRAGLIDAD